MPLSLKERRKLQMQRREIRREAFAYAEEHPEVSKEDLENHLKAEFNATIDPTILMIILEIVKLIMIWFNKEDN